MGRMRRRLLKSLLRFLLLPVLPLCISQTPPYPHVIHRHLNEQGKVFPPVNKQLYQGKECMNLSMEIQQLGGMPMKGVAATIPGN